MREVSIQEASDNQWYKTLGEVKAATRDQLGLEQNVSVFPWERRGKDRWKCEFIEKENGFLFMNIIFTKKKKKVFIQSLGTVFPLCNLLWEIFPVISQNNIHTFLVISMAFQYVQLYG